MAEAIGTELSVIWAGREEYDACKRHLTFAQRRRIERNARRRARMFRRLKVELVQELVPVALRPARTPPTVWRRYQAPVSVEARYARSRGRYGRRRGDPDALKSEALRFVAGALSIRSPIRLKRRNRDAFRGMSLRALQSR